MVRERVHLTLGGVYRRNALLRQLIEGQYQRNDFELQPGAFRVRGDTLEVFPAYEDQIVHRISFFGDEIEKISTYKSNKWGNYSIHLTLSIYILQSISLPKKKKCSRR